MNASTLDLSKDELVRSPAGQVVITNDKMDEIVRAELSRYSTKKQEKSTEKRVVVALPEKC